MGRVKITYLGACQAISETDKSQGSLRELFTKDDSFLTGQLKEATGNSNAMGRKQENKHWGVKVNYSQECRISEKRWKTKL